MRKPQPRTLLGHVGRQFLRAANNADTRDSKQVSLLYSHLKVVAQLEDRIASASLKQYRAKAAQMQHDELFNENGKASTLKRYMKHAGVVTPKYCHAHHIVPSNEILAFQTRVLLAMHKIRINDEINGVALPSSQKVIDNNLVNVSHKNRVPHLNLGKNSYIKGWLNQKINIINTPTKESVKFQLRLMQFRMETGTHPRYITEKAGSYEGLSAQTLIDLDEEGIQDLEYDDYGEKTAKFLAANPQLNTTKRV